VPDDPRSSGRQVDALDRLAERARVLAAGDQTAEDVAAEQAGVVDGQVVAVPAVQVVPPDLVAAVLGVRRGAVEVAHGQVLDPDIARPHLDPVHALPVAAIDDDPVAIQPP